METEVKTLCDRNGFSRLGFCRCFLQLFLKMFVLLSCTCLDTKYKIICHELEAIIPRQQQRASTRHSNQMQKPHKTSNMEYSHP